MDSNTTHTLLNHDNIGNEIHAYLISVDEPMAIPSNAPEMLKTFSDHEIERYHRFYFDKDRALYLVSHYILRVTLAHYLECDPQYIIYKTNQYGRPDVASPETSLRFNLTHTAGLMGIIVTDKIDCGIDVESSHKDRNILGLADHSFSQQEIDVIKGFKGAEDVKKPDVLKREKQKQRFYQYWTLKEAYIKARGMGLSLALDSFYFKVEEQPISIGFNESFGHLPENWYFEQHALDHLEKQWALAVKTDGKPLVVKSQSLTSEQFLGA